MELYVLFISFWVRGSPALAGGQLSGTGSDRVVYVRTTGSQHPPVGYRPLSSLFVRSRCDTLGVTVCPVAAPNFAIQGRVALHRPVGSDAAARQPTDTI